METISPTSEEEVAQLVHAALANETALDIVGADSRRGLGRPPAADMRVSTSRLSGVTFYEPSELVLSAGAGTPLSIITTMLDEQGQELAFEPVDHALLYGGPAQAGTIGGLVAVNASGPRRIKTGAARDHLLGFRAINGRGEVFQSGGRVMKNVTGYDMCKLMAGSYGTFGVLCEITLKVLPRAQAAITLLVTGLKDGDAIELMTRVSGLSLDISGFAHLPVLDNGFSSPALSGLADQPLTAFRIEGPQNSVEARQQQLITVLAKQGRSIEVLQADETPGFWADVRDVRPFANTNDQVWRISTVPEKGATLMKDLLARDVPVSGHYYDWAGGLIWLAVSPVADAHSPTIRQIVDDHTGHATLMLASDEVRGTVPVFHPQADAVAGLTKRLRESFDPKLVLNRGRIREDL